MYRSASGVLCPKRRNSTGTGAGGVESPCPDDAELSTLHLLLCCARADGLPGSPPRVARLLERAAKQSRVCLKSTCVARFTWPKSAALAHSCSSSISPTHRGRRAGLVVGHGVGQHGPNWFAGMGERSCLLFRAQRDRGRRPVLLAERHRALVWHRPAVEHAGGQRGQRRQRLLGPKTFLLEPEKSVGPSDEQLHRFDVLDRHAREVASLWLGWESETLASHSSNRSCAAAPSSPDKSRIAPTAEVATAKLDGASCALRTRIRTMSPRKGRFARRWSAACLVRAFF